MFQKYRRGISERVRARRAAAGVGHGSISSNARERARSEEQPFRPIAWLVDELQRSPAMRSIAYLSGAVVILEASRSGIDFTRPDATVRLHLTVFPSSAALTYLMLRLEGRTDVTPVPIRRGLAHALLGAGVGAAAWLLVLGVARAKEWVSLPAWGWKQTQPIAVIRAVMLNGIGQLAVAWNEEMLFRGYGFETLRAAVGTGATAGLLIPLFALYHGFRPRVLVGMSVAGTLFTVLRLQSHGVWFGIGYHWAWNLMQTGVFGPPDGLPSIRPLHVHDDASARMGRPGFPEPGWLPTLVSLAVTITAGTIWWLQSRHRTC
jgi:membrane protease YdiL (CAAX protease family)